MEIGQSPLWSSRNMQEKSTNSSNSSSVAEQTSILLVDIVWTLLIFGTFLGAAYLIKRSREVCYTVTNNSTSTDSAIGSCKKRPAHNHDQHQSGEINNSLVEVDRSCSSSGRSGSEFAGSVGHGGRDEMDFDISMSSFSCSSVGSNSSSSRNISCSHHHDHGLDIKIPLCSKVASSSSVVGHGQSRLPATTSLKPHEFDAVSPCRTSSPSSYDGHCQVFSLLGRSKRQLRKLTVLDSHLDEVPFSFPPSGSSMHNSRGAAGGGGGGTRRCYNYEIHGHEDLEQNLPSEISNIIMYDASTRIDTRTTKRGLVGAFGERDECGYHDDYTSDRNVEGDIEQQSQLQLQLHQLTATPQSSSLKLSTVGQRASRHARSAAAAVVVHVHKDPLPARPDFGDSKKVEEPSQVYDGNISRITQQKNTSPVSLIDYGQFHFSDPDLSDRWRP